jgi:hypothetical protein
MLIPTLVPYQKKRVPARKKPTAAPAPAPLTLVAANYEPDGPNVNLHFDRDVDISGIDPAVFTVLDGEDGWHMVGATAVMIDTTIVQVQLVRDGDYEGTSLLTAGVGNGIVAADGGTWSGTEGTGLPFP